ncbi:MAG: radical SAM family heme chaperone HemW [Clostridia bacterium]|nr:radical SAM family heme chaperone HemW [Clostridia bacterium]
MKHSKIGIYIHVPFCVSKCAYCDFYSLSQAGLEGLKDRYVDALCRQFREAKRSFGDLTASSVFMGGGTPTALTAEHFSAIFKELKSCFDLTPDAEITVESNPATFDADKLCAMRSLGVNRLSMGVQSANDAELKLLGRIHTFKDAEDAFYLARGCGFSNINLDVMYGIPSQTSESFGNTLTALTALSAEHISVYGLQLEEGTPLYEKRENYVFPDEDAVCELNRQARLFLESKGYGRYEISNYSKAGCECRHNLLYWNQGEYLGFGSGAYSFFDNRRFSFPENAELFSGADNFFDLTHTDEILTKEDAEREYVMLRLRLCEGLSLHPDPEKLSDASPYFKKAERYVKAGLMEINDGRLYFTPDGFNVSNAILSELIFD